MATKERRVGISRRQNTQQNTQTTTAQRSQWPVHSNYIQQHSYDHSGIIMKCSLILSLCAITSASAFIQHPHHARAPSSSLYAKAKTAPAPVELTPEPEGGTELTKLSSGLPNSRMKDMGLAEGAGDDVHSFWLRAVANGEEIKKLRMQTEKEASKKANFPGFRKVGELGWWSATLQSYEGMIDCFLCSHLGRWLNLFPHMSYILSLRRVKFLRMRNREWQCLLSKRPSLRLVSEYAVFSWYVLQALRLYRLVYTFGTHIHLLLLLFLLLHTTLLNQLFGTSKCNN